MGHFALLIFLGLTMLGAFAKDPGACESFVGKQFQKSIEDLEKELNSPASENQPKAQLKPFPFKFGNGEKVNVDLVLGSKFTLSQVGEEKTSPDLFGKPGETITRRDINTIGSWSANEDVDDRLEEVKKLFPGFVPAEKSRVELKKITLKLNYDRDFQMSGKNVRARKDLYKKMREEKFNLLYVDGKLAGFGGESSSKTDRLKWDSESRSYKREDEEEPEVETRKKNVLLFSHSDGCQLEDDGSSSVISKDDCNKFFEVASVNDDNLVYFSQKPDEKSPESCVSNPDAMAIRGEIPHHISKSAWKKRFSEGRFKPLENLIGSLKTKFISAGNIGAAEALAPNERNLEISRRMVEGKETSDCMGAIVDENQVLYGEAIRWMGNFCSNYKPFYKPEIDKPSKSKNGIKQAVKPQ